MNQALSFVQRYFHEDPENGMLGIGYLDFRQLPPQLHTDVHPWYGCTILLSDVLLESGAFLAHAGDVFQTFPNTPNPALERLLHLDPAPDALACLLCLGSDTYQTLSSSRLLVQDARFHIRLKSYLESWVATLVTELQNAPQEDLAETYLHMQKFLVHLHRPLLNQTNRNSIMAASAKQLLFDASLSNISLQEIAASLGFTYESFRKIFKEETGMSPLQYVLDVKFHYAERLLTEGMSVKETAQALGYADPYIFSKQFKKHIGLSPSVYKDSHSDGKETQA